jgi:ABC-type nitrate/sulfonate/bicarbonate transport system permease component
MASRGEVAAATAASQGAPATRARFRLTRLSDTAVFVFSIAVSLAAWELVSRTGLISQADLPSMSASFRELWSLVQTSDFWGALLQTVRGWALGLAVAAALAIPIGILLGSSDFAATAFRVPIEFLRPIPSAALLPVLFLTLGTTLKSEIFLAAFGAFWPLLVQTMYGVRDVDPVALDTARSFGVGRFERLYRLKLPSAVPYIATGMRISSTVSLILAFTAELFMGTPGLGQKVNFASSFGLHEQLYAYALATGFLGVAIHFFTSAAEKRVLHWHPSQRGEAV